MYVDTGSVAWGFSKLGWILRSYIGSHCLCPHTAAEPLYALGYPRNTYVAQNFDCPDFAYGFGSCNYNDTVDSDCFIGPHVAGVRCTESKFSDCQIL